MTADAEMDVVSPESVGLSASRLGRVSDWLGEQVARERLAGGSVLIGRRGKVAFFEARGLADQASARSFSRDTIVRIYSMTKPITSVAAMMLYEEGCFQLDDPVASYLPEFADTPVWAGGDAPISETVPASTPMTVHHLITHTSGLTYGFMRANAVDAAYREARVDFPGGSGDLASQVQRLAEIPLLCQPGSEWNYSVSIDVLGRLVEVWSGMSLAEFFSSRLFEPLDMRDAGFHVQAENVGRFAACYAPAVGGDLSGIGSTPSAAEQAARGGLKLQDGVEGSSFLEPAAVYAGGGGLTASMRDYSRFCQMLMNGGELDGARILSRKTLDYMRLNHLPGNRDMAAMGQPVWSETSYDGIGFGLGWAVVIDPVTARFVTSPGEHHWGGAASTFFWLDPEEDLFVILLTQLMPSSTYPLRRELRQRVYQAIVD